jgi:hypothetical protein
MQNAYRFTYLRSTLSLSFQKVIHTPQQQLQAVKNKYQYRYFKKKIGNHLQEIHWPAVLLGGYRYFYKMFRGLPVTSCHFSQYIQYHQELSATVYWKTFWNISQTVAHLAWKSAIFVQYIWEK